MSRPEYSTSARVVATTATSKNFFSIDLKAEAISILTGQSYSIDIMADEGKRIKYLASRLQLDTLTNNTPTITNGTVNINIDDCMDIDGTVESMTVAQCFFAFDGNVNFEKNEFYSSKAITIYPASGTVLADNVARLQSSKNGFMRIKITNGLNTTLNFASMGYAILELISEEELIA